MRKRILTVVIAAFTAINVIGTVACDDHEHSYNWFVVESATCTEKGKLEGICEGCGKKTYQALQKIEHDYVGGYCTMCGKDETGRTPDDPLPEVDENAGYTFSDIYDESKLLGYAFTKNEFFDFLTSNGKELPLRDFYLNAFNHLRLTVGKQSVSIGDVRENFSYPWQNKLQNVAQIYFSEDECPRLTVVTIDGIKTDYGYLKETFKGQTDEALLEKVVLNNQNELIFIYDDNSVKKAGKIPEEKTDVDSSALIYVKTEDGYYVDGAMDQNIETLTVPETHRGKLVIGISPSAFSYQQAPCLKSADLSSKNLRSIGSLAFYSSTLTNVTIGINVNYIASHAFAYSNLESAKFLDTKNWYTECYIDNHEPLALDVQNETVAAQYLLLEHKYFPWYKT